MSVELEKQAKARRRTAGVTAVFVQQLEPGSATESTPMYRQRDHKQVTKPTHGTERTKDND